jgi:hypothetical protein
MIETIDPLVNALRFFQADADNRESPESISYIALNNALAGEAGYIDDVEFARRFEEDPTLQQYVDGYDKAGVRLKTNAPQQPDHQSDDTEMQHEPTGAITSMAKQAAKRRIKK